MATIYDNLNHSEKAQYRLYRREAYKRTKGMDTPGLIQDAGSVLNKAEAKSPTLHRGSRAPKKPPPSVTANFRQSISGDPFVKGIVGVGKGLNKGLSWGSGKLSELGAGRVVNRNNLVGKVSRKAGALYSKIPKGLKRMGGLGGLALGATAMLGIGIMRGMMRGTQDAVYDRYMTDARYSRNMLYNSRVGSASGTNKMLRNSGTQGLSLAMSKNRHGSF